MLSGSLIQYSVKEVGENGGRIAGKDGAEYSVTYAGMNVKNSYSTTKVTVSGSKTWADADDQDGKRPESIKVSLYANGEFVEAKEVKAVDDWTWTFENLLKYKEGKVGQEIVYTVEEDPVLGYVTTVDGMNITNTITKVSVSKVDITDARELEGAHIQILDKDGNVVEEWDSTKEAHEVTGLKTGETYTLRETVAPDGYAVTTDTTFALKADGTIDSEKTDTTTKDGVLLVEDAKSIEVSKVDLGTGEELSGAHIQVVDKEGNVIDEWDSEAGVKHVVKNVKVGETYTLRETVAPDGYTVTTDTSFSIDKTGKVTGSVTVNKEGVVLVEDTKTSVKISKVDITDARELEGAHIQILDKDGNVVEEWDSTKEAHEVTGLKTGETYTLRETVAPDGYAVTTDTTFALKADGTIDSEKTDTTTKDGVLLVEDAKSIEVSKVDLGTGEELSGAHIQVVDKEGNVIDEWDSEAGVKHVVKNVKVGETYTLRETVAPDGYTVTTDTSFSIDKTGKVTGSVTTNKDGVVLVQDGKTSVKISKVDVTNQKELAGAHIQILDKDGKVVAEWTSEEKAHEIIGLKAGETYTLRETVAPNGYGITSDTVFVLDKDGNIDKTKTSTKVNENGVLLVEDSQTEVTLSKKDAATDQELAGAHLILKDADGKILEDWITDGTPKTLKGKLIAGNTYVLTEISAPAGYAVAADVKFTVDENGKPQTVVMKDKKAEGKAELTVQKIVKQNNKLNPLEDYTFYTALFADKELTQRVSGVQALRVQKSYSAETVFKNLDYGTYYVAETDEFGEAITSGMFIESNEIVNGEVELTPKNATAKSKIINHVVDFPDNFYKDGKVEVTKKVIGNGEAYPVTDTFYFALFLDEEMTAIADYGVKSLTLNNESEGKVTFDQVAYGEYYLAETNEEGKPVDASFKYVVSVDKNHFEITEEDKTASVTVTNTDVPSGPYDDGKITVNKYVMTGKKETKVKDTFYFALFTDKELTKVFSDAGIQELELDNESQGSVTFENLPYGTYYLAETDEDGMPVDSDFDYTVAIDKSQVTLTADDHEAVVKVTNKKTPDTETETESETESETTPTKKTTNTPKTGDDTNIAFYLTLMMMAALVGTGYGIRRRKKKEQK